MHPEIELVHVLGLILLTCGSFSLLIVHLTSRGLKGVSWFSASFALGAAGTGLLLARTHPVFSVLLADLAMIGSFTLQHIAALQLDRPSQVPFWRGFALLGIQAVVDGLHLWGVASARPGVVCYGLLVSLQVAATAWLLWRSPRAKVRAPATFNIVLLLGFGAFNLLHSVLVGCGCLSAVWQSRFTFLAFTLYLAVALGLAFGFFWVTTATLTADVEHLASTDPLTRLYNRRVFLRWCEKELLRCQRANTPFSLLMLDLDHFKMINDNFGHQRGDEVLCAAVERMQDSVRGIDVLCRWGGEEFAVLLPNASASATGIVAERIRENVRKLHIALRPEGGDGCAPYLTVSIGAATYRDLDDNLKAMLLRADRALYRAKASGRDQVLVGV